MSERSVSALQTRALAEIDGDADRHLRLGVRQEVWAALGPRRGGEGPPTGAHLRRLALAVAGVRRVLPLWDRRYPGNDLPSVALGAVGALLRGEIGVEEAQRVFDRCWGDAVHLAVDRPFPEVAAGFAAVQALGTAMYDEFFDPDSLDPARPDEDDPESHDSAYYAAVAEAGGMPGDPDADRERRREFWRWWLGEAVEPTVGVEDLKKL